MGRSGIPPIDLYPGTVDSHFHATVMEERGLDVEALLTALQDAGLSRGLDVAISLSGMDHRMTRRAAFPFLCLTMGFHPSQAGEVEIESLRRRLPEALSTPGVVALGEIGLDWYRNYATPQDQIELFEVQLEIAKETALPVVIHNRDATRDVLRILRDARPPRGGVMHCFSEGWEEATSFLDMGFFLSFAGNVTYPRLDAVREVARLVPPDRYLIETDSPFLAPQNVRGMRNHPGTLGEVIRCIGEARSQRPEEVVHQTAANFESIFGK